MAVANSCNTFSLQMEIDTFPFKISKFIQFSPKIDKMTTNWQNQAEKWFLETGC